MKNIKLVFCLSLLCFLLTGCNNESRIKIPYESSLDSAAIHQSELKQLENSVIFGNGDINGLVYSVDGNITISLTKNDVWDGRLITKDDPPLFKVDIRNRKWSGGAPEYTVPPSYDNYAYPCPVYCAIVSIGQKDRPLTALSGEKKMRVTVNEQLQKIPVESKLDLKKAVVTVFKGEHNAGVKVRALAQKNVYLIESDGEVFLNPNRIGFIPEPKTGIIDGIDFLHYSITGDLDWKGLEYAVTKSSVEGKTIIAIVTSKESDNCLNEAISLTKETIAESSGKLIREHESIWKDFWSKSGIQVSDNFISRQWYRSLYFMRCISKEGVMPAALFASLEPMDNFSWVAWKGNFTMDYNAEQMYWAWYSCNHAELSAPYEKLIIDFLPRAKWFARETYNCDGAFFPVNIYLYEPQDIENLKSVNKRMTAYVPWTYVNALAGWVVQNLWLHYKYYPDKELLSSTLCQPLKEVAAFYLDFLSQCKTGPDGKAIIGPSYSPEHGHFGIYQGTADITFMRMMFNIIIECNKVLNNDHALADKCSEALKHLPAYPLSNSDPPVVTDYENSTTAEFNVTVPVLPVYPAGEINYFSPEETKELFERTIDSIRWNGNNGVVTLAAARARLSMPATLEWLKANFQKRLRENGTFSLNQLEPHNVFNDYGHYTEQFAFSGVVNEMLLQGLNGIIRFFPAWPAEIDASFTNLRTEGGFLVTAEIKNGKVGKIIIQSTVGGKLTFLNIRDSDPIVTVNNKPVQIKNIGNGLYSLETEVNDIIEINNKK
jgi:hypothetical protein